MIVLFYFYYSILFFKFLIFFFSFTFNFKYLFDLYYFYFKLIRFNLIFFHLLIFPVPLIINLFSSFFNSIFRGISFSETVYVIKIGLVIFSCGKKGKKPCPFCSQFLKHVDLFIHKILINWNLNLYKSNVIHNYNYNYTHPEPYVFYNFVFDKKLLF